MADRKQRNIQEDSTDGEYSSGSPSTSSRGADPELGVRVSTGDEAYISGTLDDSYVSDPLLNGCVEAFKCFSNDFRPVG
jgi:hypothetical protein